MEFLLNTNIQCVILSHDLSQKFTDDLTKNLNDYVIYDSSFYGTPFAISFNLALSLGLDYGHDWVMVCNNDITLTQTDLDTLSEILSQCPAGVYSPRVIGAGHGHKHMEWNLGSDVVRKTSWLEFVCPIIHRQVASNIGGVDENFTMGYGVDCDYCYRARQLNFNVGIIQPVQIQHFEHKSQGVHLEYRKKAEREMAIEITKKYGSDWRKLLDFYP